MGVTVIIDRDRKATCIQSQRDREEPEWLRGEEVRSPRILKALRWQWLGGAQSLYFSDTRHLDWRQ